MILLTRTCNFTNKEEGARRRKEHEGGRSMKEEGICTWYCHRARRRRKEEKRREKRKEALTPTHGRVTRELRRWSRRREILYWY